MEAILNGRYLQVVPRLVVQGHDFDHGHVTTLNQDLVASTAVSLGKIHKHLNATCFLVQVQ